MELRTLLEETARQGASDLHLAAGVPPILRFDGELVVFSSPACESESARHPLLTPDDMRDIVAQIETLPGSCGPDRNGSRTAILRIDSTSFRVTVFPECGVPVIAVRVVPRHVPRMIDLFGERYPLFDMVKLRRGLIVVAGSTASGKSTTVMSMIEEINHSRSERIHIIGLEYLIGPKMSLVTQHIEGIDFEHAGDAIKSVGAMDPDIVVIIDPQDEASILGALRLAKTGHLVLMTIHADSASDALHTIASLTPGYPELVRKQLADTLHAVIAQRLIRRSPEQGRVPVHEILMATPWVKERIRAGDLNFSDVARASRGEGMRSMDDSLLELLSLGRISYQTAFDNVNNLRRMPQTG